MIEFMYSGFGVIVVIGIEVVFEIVDLFFEFFFYLEGYVSL